MSFRPDVSWQGSDLLIPLEPASDGSPRRELSLRVKITAPRMWATLFSDGRAGPSLAPRALEGVEKAAPEAAAAQTVVSTHPPPPPPCFLGGALGRGRRKALEPGGSGISRPHCAPLCARHCSQHHASLKALHAQDITVAPAASLPFNTEEAPEEGEGVRLTQEPAGSSGAGTCTPQV